MRERSLNDCTGNRTIMWTIRSRHQLLRRAESAWPAQPLCKQMEADITQGRTDSLLCLALTAARITAVACCAAPKSTCTPAYNTGACTWGCKMDLSDPLQHSSPFVSTATAATDEDHHRLIESGPRNGRDADSYCPPMNLE